MTLTRLESLCRIGVDDCTRRFRETWLRFPNFLDGRSVR
jgi:hypothetical protein